MKQNLGFVLNKKTENHKVNSIADYYKISLAILLIAEMPTIRKANAVKKTLLGGPPIQVLGPPKGVQD